MKFFYPMSQYEIDNGLDVPLIDPALIPKEYIQDWNPYTRAYRLVHRRYPPKNTGKKA